MNPQLIVRLLAIAITSLLLATCVSHDPIGSATTNPPRAACATSKGPDPASALKI